MLPKILSSKELGLCTAAWLQSMSCGDVLTCTVLFYRFVTELNGFGTQSPFPYARTRSRYWSVGLQELCSSHRVGANQMWHCESEGQWRVLTNLYIGCCVFDNVEKDVRDCGRGRESSS